MGLQHRRICRSGFWWAFGQRALQALDGRCHRRYRSVERGDFSGHLLATPVIGVGARSLDILHRNHSRCNHNGRGDTARFDNCHSGRSISSQRVRKTAGRRSTPQGAAALRHNTPGIQVTENEKQCMQQMHATLGTQYVHVCKHTIPCKIHYTIAQAIH